MSVLFFVSGFASAKQLAEQLVNLTVKGEKTITATSSVPCEEPECDTAAARGIEKTDIRRGMIQSSENTGNSVDLKNVSEKEAIREGGRTVGAGQAVLSEDTTERSARTGRNSQTGKEIKMPVDSSKRTLSGSIPKYGIAEKQLEQTAKKGMGEYVRELAKEAKNSGVGIGQLVSQKAKTLVGNKTEAGAKVSKVTKQRDGSAVVHLKTPAKLFGFISMPLDLKVLVSDNEKEQVKIKKPFFAFLFSFDEEGAVTSLFDLMQK